MIAPAGPVWWWLYMIWGDHSVYRIRPMLVVSGIADQPVTAPLAQQPPRSDMPRAVKDEVVVLLAGMALGSMQGVTA